MRVLLGGAMAAAAAGLASMAHLTATSTWLVLVPGFVLAGIGLGITSTGLASAALAAVEPARAGMAAGLTNTLRQVGTATGVAVLGALYGSRVTTATLHALGGLPAPPGAVHRLAAAVASGAGTRVAAAVPPAARAAVTHAARAGTASGLNDVLIAAAAFAVLGAIAGFGFGPDPARQPPTGQASDESSAQPAPAQHKAKRPAGPPLPQAAFHPRCHGHGEKTSDNNPSSPERVAFRSLALKEHSLMDVMDQTVDYRAMAAATRDRTHSLFAQTMGYVAATAALFALGAYLGRNLGSGVTFIAFVASFACLIGMQFAARRSAQLTLALLAAFGFLLGLALAMTPGQPPLIGR